MTTQQLISEISLRCGDPEFKDFDAAIYKRAAYRANREIAKAYGLFQKVFSFTTGNMVTDLSQAITLDIPDFKSEYLVMVNDVPLVKVANVLESQFRYCYYMERIEGIWYFDYQLDYLKAIESPDITETMSMSHMERLQNQRLQTPQKSAGDKVVIAYNIIPNLETEIGEYDIDTKYEEEQINRGVHYMALLGIAKYPGQNEKADKYGKLFSTYKVENRSEYDKNIAKDSEWVKIQPWSVV